MTFEVPERVKNHLAGFWLNRHCTVVRVTGYGGNSDPTTVYDDILYKKEFGSTPRMVGIGGGFQAEVTYTLKFESGTDIQSKDVVTDLDTGEQFNIDDEISGSHEMLKAMSATRLTP